MKTIKRVAITIFILLTVGFLFRGLIFRQLVTYKSIGRRTTYAINSDKLTDYIDVSIGRSDLTIYEIAKLGQRITSQQLEFSVNKNDNNPNKLINSRAAHCVGYTAFFVSTSNYLLKKYNLDDTWMAKPQIGQLYFLGANIHTYVNTPFFKDHDFATLENKRTGEVFAVDPTVNDYFFIDFVTYESND